MGTREFDDNGMEIWEDGGQQWRRTAHGEFQLRSIGGEALPEAFDAADKAALAGAHRVEENGKPHFYPKSFKFSPLTGQALADPPQAQSIWLPPWGDQAAAYEWHGLRRTSQPLALPANLRAEAHPQRQIPLQEGDHRFLVARLQTPSTWLLSYHKADGLLAVWSAAKKWLPLGCKNGLRLTGSSLGEHWGMLLEHTESKRCILPSDDGLTVLDIDIARLSYQILARFPGACRSAPTPLDGHIYWLAQCPEGRVGIYQLPFGAWDTTPTPVECPGLPTELPNTQTPLVKTSRLYWLGDAGCVQVALDAANHPEARFTPWPKDSRPQFEFGSPYCDSAGELWQLCFDSHNQHYLYSKLPAFHTRHPVSAPRFVTGAASALHTDIYWATPPWQEPETTNTTPSLAIPLLESRLGYNVEAVLLARINAWVGDSQALFAAPLQRHDVDFEIRGKSGTVSFFKQRISQPWLTKAVVYNACLYLYHPDFGNALYGWQLLD